MFEGHTAHTRKLELEATPRRQTEGLSERDSLLLIQFIGSITPLGRRGRREEEERRKRKRQRKRARERLLGGLE